MTCHFVFRELLEGYYQRVHADEIRMDEGDMYESEVCLVGLLKIISTPLGSLREVYLSP